MAERRASGIVGSLFLSGWLLALAAQAQVGSPPFPEPAVESLRPPFFDDFRSPNVDTARWSRALGVQAGFGPAHAEPGVRLDGTGQPPPRVAELWTAPVDLERSGPVRIGVIARPGSPQTAAPLVIEYLSAAGGWRELRRARPGAEVAAGGPYLDVLPADGQHRFARLRLRVELGTATDGWILREVAIVPARYSLTVVCRPECGVEVSVAPADLLGHAGGGSALMRFFEEPTLATLSAPARTNRWVFERWEIGGRTCPDGQNVVTRMVDRDLAALAEYAALGDLNGDGLVDRYDLDAFVLATVDREGYAERYPDLDRLRRGDMNGDGVIDELDIEPFVERLLAP